MTMISNPAQTADSVTLEKQIGQLCVRCTGWRRKGLRLWNRVSDE